MIKLSPRRRQDPKHRPAEGVMHYVDDTFYTLGYDFDPAAPYAGCRLCGAVYQSDDDRLARWLANEGRIKILTSPVDNEEYYVGEDEDIEVYERATERRARWNELHRRRYHTESEIEVFERTGFAFTPEAAHKLAPLGLAPLGNLHEDIMDAMATAPRAPQEEPEN